MVSELIDKYIWLVQTFIDAGPGGLSLPEIAARWTARYGGADYPRRSFNNHREAVAEVFGIEIACNRSTNRGGGRRSLRHRDRLQPEHQPILY